MSSVLSLSMEWGRITIPTITSDAVRSDTGVPDELSAMFVSFLSGQTLPVTGASGRIETLGLKIPYWVAAVLVATSSVMILMNIYKFGDFPVLMLMSLYGVAAIIVVGAGTEIMLNGKLSPTYAVACIGPIAGLVLTWYIDPSKN
ncbi:hypothetical protein SH501x_002274 [Pirellulaceae bacterium SH501]